MKTTYFTLLALTLLLLVSCTIEKRLHQPGWHVEWKKKLPASSGEVTASEAATDSPTSSTLRPTEDLPVETTENNTSLNAETPEAEPFPIQNTLRSDETDGPLISEKALSPTIDDTVPRQRVVLRTVRPPDLGERDPLTVPLWTLAAVSMLVITLAAILLLFASPTTMVFLILMFVELPVLLIARVVLAIFIRKREREQPDKYRYSKNVLLAVFLPEIYFAFAGILTILLAILIFA